MALSWYIFAKPTLRLLFLLILLVVIIITAAATGFDLFYRVSYTVLGVLVICYFWSLGMLLSVRVEITGRLNQTKVGESFEQRIKVINSSFIPKYGLELKDMTNLPGHKGGVAINIQSYGEYELDLYLKARK
ncbi:uncharacterized protein METZ01_LOCUS419137, partial [marine metagenome]